MHGTLLYRRSLTDEDSTSAVTKRTPVSWFHFIDVTVGNLCLAVGDFEDCGY